MTSPTVDSEITWLLHRAAQRLRGATGEVAEQHGLTMRDYIVLSALDKTPGLTQGELAKRLGVARNTITRWERGFLPRVPKYVDLAVQALTTESQGSQGRGRK